MNQEESIELFLKGKDAWNAWAQEKLAEKSILTHKMDKDWSVREQWDIHGNNVKLLSDDPTVQQWLDKAKVDLSNLEITTTQDNFTNSEIVDANKWVITGDSINFKEFIFPSEVTFENTFFKNVVIFSKATFHHNVSFRNVHFLEKADFDGSIFHERTDFTNSTIKNYANFGKTRFKKPAYFYKSSFNHGAWFGDARFESTIGFDKASFGGPVSFVTTIFKDKTYFVETSFLDSADFSSATFEKLFSFTDATFKNGIEFSNAKFNDFALFRRAIFFKSLDFTGVSSKRLIDFSDAQFFFFVPDFTLLESEKPPRLDRIAIRYVNRRKQNFEKKIVDPRPCLLKFMEVAPNQEAYLSFRKLKKVTIESHDHLGELDMFIEEMKARRFWLDKPFEISGGTLRFWLGTIYGGVSDWGRSLWRPLALWFITLFLFAQIYASIGVMNQYSTTAYVNNTWCKRLPQQINLFLTNDFPCRNNHNFTSKDAAYTIGFKNSLLFISMDRTEKLKRAYACLYGTSPLYDTKDYKEPKPKPQLAPNIPFSATIAGLCHTVLSLTFIFLFLLALRNHFKIK